MQRQGSYRAPEPSTFGSSAAFGRLPDGAAERADSHGVTIAAALRAIGESGDPRQAKRELPALAAYLELHIEQGPRLAEQEYLLPRRIRANRREGIHVDPHAATFLALIHCRV